jgi:hypothetical protein
MNPRITRPRLNRVGTAAVVAMLTAGSAVALVANLAAANSSFEHGGPCRPASGPVSHPVSKPVSAHVSRPVSPPVCPPISKPVSHPVSSPVSHPVHPPVTHPPVTHPDPHGPGTPNGHH